MNKCIFTFALVSLFFTNTTWAQLRRGTQTSLESLKTARKEMELNTENQILEKLEEARLEDEKNRRTQFESLNFSVVNDGSNVAR